MTTPPVLELRLVITTDDFERLTRFYCQGLGLQPEQSWSNEQGRSLVLNLGQATLELFDETQAASVDQIETGRRVSGAIRLAIQVPDLEAALPRLLEHGASLVHPPVVTPWGDYNVRIQDPEGLQVTVFEARPPAVSPS